MDIKSLLTNFDGRIGRKNFWIGMLCIVVLAFALILVLGLTLGLFLPTGFVSLLGYLLLLYPVCAVLTKRLHDRDKDQTPWLYIFVVPGLLMNTLAGFHIGFETIAVGDDVASYPSSAITWLLSVISMIVGFWALIELGFLRGTIGSNKYGEDPVG